MRNDVTPTAHKDHLFTLIKSLDKAEKRHFKLYVNRVQSKGDVKFVQLFDVLDKLKEYDEVQIFKIPGIKKSQLPNLKRHLYKQILTSLRLVHLQKNVDIQIRDQIDHARILYAKGLYLQSLRLLDRLKPLAEDNNQNLLLLEILEFQKLIEERHITRSRKVKGKVETLIDEAAQRSGIINNSCKLSNLKIKIHGWYITMGHAKNEKDRMVVDEYFKANLPKNTAKLTFFEEVYLQQSYVWYHYILLDFRRCAQAAVKWVNLFKKQAHMKEKDPDLYMRGLHYVLTSFFNLKEGKKMMPYLEEFEAFVDAHQKSFNTISKTLAFLYIYTAKLNMHFINGNYEEGEDLVPHIHKEINRYEASLDQHRIMVFYYKIAYLYLRNGKYNKVIDYLNQIIDLKAGHLREDIRSYARLMQLIAHYELGHYELMEYLINSAHRFMDRVEELNKMQQATLRFFRQLVKQEPGTLKKELQQFKAELNRLRKDPYEKRAFLYLDILYWVDNKL